MVVVAKSSLLFVCSRTARRLGPADASALPGIAAVLPAQVSAWPARRAEVVRRGGVAADLGELGETDAAPPWPGCRRARGRGSRAPGAAAAVATSRAPRGRAVRRSAASPAAAAVAAELDACVGDDPRCAGRLGGGKRLAQQLLGLARDLRARARSTRARRERTPRGRRTPRGPRARARAGTPPPRPRRPCVAPRPTPRAAAPGRGRRRSRSRRSDGGRPPPWRRRSRRRRRAPRVSARMRLLAATPQSSSRRLERGRPPPAPVRRRVPRVRIAPGRARASICARPSCRGGAPVAASDERPFAGRERRLQVALLGREVAERRRAPRPAARPGRLRAIAARASSTKRRPSDTRPARPKYHPSVPQPNRDERGRAHPERTRAPPRGCRSRAPGGAPNAAIRGPRSSSRASSASAAKYSAWAPRAAASPPLSASRSSTYSRTVSSMSYRAAPPENEADTIDLSTSAPTRYATVASFSPCDAAIADERRAARRRRGGRRAAGAASSRPRARGRSSSPRAPAAPCGPGRAAGAVAAERRATLEHRERAPRARARSHARRRARWPTAVRPRAARSPRPADRLGVELEARPRRPRPLEEELDRRGAPDLRAACSGTMQRCDGDPHLARDAKRLAARRQDPHARSTRQAASTRSALPRRARARTHRERPGRSASRSRDVTRASGSEPRTSRACASRRTCVGRLRLPARSSTTQMPSGNSRSERTRGLHREPALAHARRPGERHEAVLAQQVGDLAQIVLAADERRRDRRQIAAPPATDRQRRRWPGRGPGSRPGCAAARVPARDPARRRAPAAPPGTPRARPPGGRCDTAPASAGPTAARGRGSRRAPTEAPARAPDALRAPAPPRIAPPARRHGAPRAAAPRR